MAVQRTKSNLMAKLGDRLREAHEEHRNDETEFSNFGELPEGINDGIAQLRDCKFDKIKEGKDGAGEYYFYAAGVVESPKEFGGQRIEGLRTMITEPLYDTPTRTRKTVADHIKWIYNELRKLGVDTSTLEVEDLEPTVAALREVKPYFKFRTWKGDMQTTGPYANKEPRVQHQWLGACEYVPDNDPTAGTEDDTSGGQGADSDTSSNGADDSEVPSNGEEEEKTHIMTGRKLGPPPSTKVGTAKVDTKATKSKKVERPAFDDQGDIDTLVKRAKKGDTAARQELAELAVANGADPDVVEKAKSWDDVALMALGQGPTPEEEDAAQEPEPEEVAEEVEPEEADEPKVGELWWYRPLDKETRKPAKKAVECEVTKIYPPSRLLPKGAADVRCVATRTMYRGVALGALMPSAGG